MRKNKWIIATIVVLLILGATAIFYAAVFRGNQSEDYTSFAEDLTLPDGITMIDKIDKPLVAGSKLREGEIEIYDEIVVKTIVLEIKKSSLEKATKRDKQNIAEADRAFSIGTIYKETPISGKLGTIEVLNDGSFITSKYVNGKEQFVRGKFGKYTMDYFTGLYTLR
ncbi:MAG: hypothetical protein WBL93_14485 [Lutisporaceae bacterium]